MLTDSQFAMVAPAVVLLLGMLVGAVCWAIGYWMAVHNVRH